jgi:ATP-dependent RNA helicase DDX60
VILFNYNRSFCEDIVEHLLDQLVEAENQFKKKDKSWQLKIEKYTRWLKEAPARQKVEKLAQQNKKTTKAKGAAKDEDQDALGSKADRAYDAVASKDLFFETFDPADPLAQFSFANIKKGDKSHMKKMIRHFERAEIPEKLIHAFKRGICVHHAGMNRWYRQAAEMFFRRGFLTVVVATGTLSLGINMPCKTVVFSGDSAYLTALNYRQSSGRAGRRGFDLLGNVVFQEFPPEKALRLISSKLPDINGHFPMTTGFVLRILTLLHGTSNAEYAMGMANALLAKPRLYSGGEDFKQQVLHHVRFSIEYLRTQGLLDSDGSPIGFASCVSHLYYVENSALAFHALLREGYFTHLAKEFASRKELTLKRLMLVLSNIFGRRPMRKVETEEDKNFVKRSVNMVELPDLPKKAASILSKHNKQTLSTYRTYVSTYVEQHLEEPDVTLPFTGKDVSPSSKSEVLEIPRHLSPPKMRSPFVALSGLDDKFTSISDLCNTVRGGVFLEEAVIPYLDMVEELKSPLNAYLYDFYNHGSVKALLEANRIPRGDIWFLLKDFSLVIATIVTSIENFLNPKQDPDAGFGDEADFANDDEMTLPDDEKSKVPEQSLNLGLDELILSGDDSDSDEDSDDETLVETPDPRPKYHNKISTLSVETPSKAKKSKTKVLDSWDDEASEGSESDYDGTQTQQAKNKAAEEREKLRDQAAVEKMERELRAVYRMFKRLQTDFEVKFHAMWA